MVMLNTNGQPEAKGSPPQQVYETKSLIVRFNQVIWYILGIMETLLAFRLILKILGASLTSGFTRFIYNVTEPMARPFRGILGVSSAGTSTMEWTTIIAALVYFCVAWGLIYMLQLFFPITPNDVETE